MARTQLKFIAANGVRDATTFLRGDGSWAVPPSLGGGGAVDVIQTEIDFGSSGVHSKSFTVANSAVLLTSQIIAQVAFQAGSGAGRMADEAEMEPINIVCRPTVMGQFEMRASAMEGRAHGTYLVNYLVG